MVEATDDSYLLGLGLAGLKTFTLKMERFQFAYGWVTNWPKTSAFVLNPDTAPLPEKILFPSVSTNLGADLMTMVEHEVPLIVDNMDFLRTAIDDPISRHNELKEIIENFQFPYTLGRPQLTLIRKVVAQKITSRCRALISLQPLKPQDAEALDRAIILRVHHLLGFPYRPSTELATLPISLHGFGFPSLTRINAGIAVNGIVRDLNHHIPAYRTMARITLAEWTCDRNGCVDPFSEEGMKRDFNLHFKLIPSGWLIAHKVMKAISPHLLLRRTDQSAILAGEVSISHVLNLSHHHSPQEHVKRELTGPGMRSLRAKGIRQIKDVGSWIEEGGTRLVMQRQIELDGLWSEAARRNWTKLGKFMRKVRLETLLNGPADLAVPPLTRRRQAEGFIAAAAQICEFQPSHIAGPRQWASDGSMIPASASLLQDKSVIGAATGASGSLALKLKGGNISILHGELAGLIIALVLGKACPDQTAVRGTLWTDHLNSVRLIEDYKSSILQEARLRHINGRSLYRWIVRLLDEQDETIRTNVVYTPGHSSLKTLPAMLNANADHHASKSQGLTDRLLCFPGADFAMDDFTLYRRGYGWIESNIANFVDAVLISESAKNLARKPRMATFVYDPTPPPEFSYVRATSAYSAAVQLYARSGQLPTVELDRSRGARECDRCLFQCNVKGDVHHLFTHCARYKQWRADTASELVRKTGLLIKDKGLSSEAEISLSQAAKSLLFDDDAIWPLKYTQFYLGLLPSLSKWINATTMPSSEVMRRKLKSLVSCEWHTQSIRLAGRIYGDYQREKAILNGCEKSVRLGSNR